MLYMIHIWCPPPSPPPTKCACTRICSKLKVKPVYLLLIRQASASLSTPLERPPGQWPRPCHYRRQWANSRQHNPTATTPLACATTLPAACSRRQPGLDINDAGVRRAPSGRATPMSSISAKAHSSTWWKREPSVSFNFAESQQKMSFKHNKGINGTGNWHKEHMLYKICYITSNWRPCKKIGCCYVAIRLLYNKKCSYIAHPILQDDDSDKRSVSEMTQTTRMTRMTRMTQTLLFRTRGACQQLGR